MTKDVLQLKFIQSRLTLAEFEEFFESNVCIPKGENSSRYANEIHCYAEGIPVQIKSPSGLWTDLLMDEAELRIKPSEPVYEWQWYYVEDGEAIIACLGQFMTDKEANADTPYWSKFEETKRLRLQ